MTWGIVGTGAIAARFAVAAHEAGHSITAIASRTADSGQNFAARFGIAQAVEGIEALVKLPDIHAIYIATPNATHAETALNAIGAGKAVLCEKPLALSAAEAAPVIAAAQEAGVFCMEGLWSLTLPTVRDCFAAVQSGQIGTLREIQGSFGMPQSPEVMPRLFAPEGGGALLDRGVYLLAIARAFLGDEIRLVHASGDMTAERVDLAATMILENGAGARAVLSCAIDRMCDNRLTLVGSHGRIVWNEPVPNPQGYVISKADPMAQFSGPRGMPSALGRMKAVLTSTPRLRTIAKAALNAPQGRAGSLANQIDHVEYCLNEGLTESPLVPLESSLKVLRLIDAARAQI